MLAASGQLNLRMGGPGYYFWEKSESFIVTFEPKQTLGPDEFRRMVYQYKPKTQQDPTFGAFDCADGALVTPRRTVSTTALQALNLLNSDFMVEQSAAMADRLAREAGTQAAQQAACGFQLAFGRSPTDREQVAAAALIAEHGLAALCRALYNTNEFVYVLLNGGADEQETSPGPVRLQPARPRFAGPRSASWRGCRADWPWYCLERPPGPGSACWRPST